jgi:hypothetical protein
MRQECRVTVTLTYDCDARLTRDELLAAIMADIDRLAIPGASPVEMNGGQILELQEEAAIYGNA